MERSLVLASTSPRRRILLAELEVPFTVVAPTLEEEQLEAGLSLPWALEKLALAKARSVAVSQPTALVIGADTLVAKDGVRLGKPTDPAEAMRMLQMLSGATHEVITAVAMYCGESGQTLTNHAVSKVRFRTLSEKEITDYIASGEPFDKAGGYGIQGAAGEFVAALDGDFDNVVGLPLSLVKQMFATWGRNQA